jgi:hypothetical protein
MKKLFPGHFKKTETEIKDLWQNCIFAFDTKKDTRYGRASEKV